MFDATRSLERRMMVSYTKAVDPHDVAAYSKCAQFHRLRNFPFFRNSENAKIIAASHALYVSELNQHAIESKSNNVGVSKTEKLNFSQNSNEIILPCWSSSGFIFFTFKMFSCQSCINHKQLHSTRWNIQH